MTSNLEILHASLEDKPLIQRMLELYLYDFSVFDQSDLNEHGHFGYPYLDLYWTEQGRHPFIVRVDGKLAGFVPVNRHTLLPNSEFFGSLIFAVIFLYFGIFSKKRGSPKSHMTNTGTKSKNKRFLPAFTGCKKHLPRNIEKIRILAQKANFQQEHPKIWGVSRQLSKNLQGNRI